MAKQIGFLTIGITNDQYLYIETDTGESFAIGSDIGTGTFNINSSPSANVSPDEATSNFAIDPSANGDIVLQPNGTGETNFTAGDVTITTGNLNIQGGNLLLAGISGTDGQLLIGNSAGNAAWADLTSTDASVSITSGPNSLDLSVSGGAAADTFQTDSGIAIPIAGILDVLGGSNINTAGVGNTLTVNLNDNVTISGNYTTTNGNLAVNAGTATVSGNIRTTTGDVIVSAGNIRLPRTDTALSEGVIEYDGVRFIHGYGVANFWAGSFAGNGTLIGSHNTGVGVSTGRDITTGGGNTIMGSGAGEELTSGAENTAIGRLALTDLTLGDNNSCLGFRALGGLDNAGSDNIAIGHQAGFSLTGNNSDNIIIGNAGTSGDNNTIRIGTQGTGSGQQDTTFIAGITSQTITGSTSKPVVVETDGQLGVAGNLNLPDTNAAGTEGVISFGTDTTTLHNKGTNSIYVGRNAGLITNTGSSNTGCGVNALMKITTGSFNTAVGLNAFVNMLTGTQGVAVGYTAGQACTGGQNTLVGFGAGLGFTSGTHNTAVGFNAGSSLTTTDSDNIMVGNAGTSGDNNTIRIGTQGTGSGQQDTTFVAGIYNTTPAGGNDGMVIIDSNGQLGSQTDLLMPNNPAFLVYNSAEYLNVTGAGTVVTVEFDSTVYDQDSNFNNVTDTFTAPVTGRYLLSATVFLRSVSSAMTSGRMTISTSNSPYYFNRQNIGAVSDPFSGTFTCQGTIVADMDAADTAFVQVVLQNGAGNTAGILGNGNPIWTRFSGVLVS